MLPIAAVRPKGLVAAGVSYSAAANAYFARLASPPSDAAKALYNSLFVSVGAAILAKLDVLNVSGIDSATQLTNLISASYNSTLSGTAPTFAANAGFTGNGTTSYVDINFNPTTAIAANYAQNSACVFGWSNKTTADGGAIIGNVGGKTSLYPRFTDDKYYSRLNNAAVDINGASADGKGFWLDSRTASNLHTLYKNGSSVGTDATASAALVNGTIAALRSASDFFAGQCLVWGLGGALTAGEVATLYAAIHTYEQAVAGVA